MSFVNQIDWLPKIGGVCCGKFVGTPCPTAPQPFDGLFGLIAVGSLTQEKAPESLMSLSAELNRTGRSFQLFLVGEGPLRSRLEQRIKDLGLAHCVHLLGVRGDIPALLAAADLFLMPSRTESMPAALIEAELAEAVYAG